MVAWVVMVWAVVKVAEVPMFDSVLVVGFNGQLILEAKEELI